MAPRKTPTENSATDERLEELHQRERAAEEGGGAARREKQHKAGKLSPQAEACGLNSVQNNT